MKSTVSKSVSIVILMAIVCCSCQNNQPAVENNNGSHKDAMLIASYSFKTADGWGYCITVDDKLYIKQSVIPDIEGNKSFTTEKDAAKVASLVTNKIKLHQKPTVFKEELQKLNIAE
jgi:hypothetical protein